MNRAERRKAQTEQATPTAPAKPFKRMHAFIATPAYDGKVETNYALSLGETGQVCTLMAINLTISCMGNGAFIDLARNNFVKLFLESDCTHLFFIDADLRWEARAVAALVQADLPVCAGTYPKRQDPIEFPVHLAVDENGAMICEGGWVMCDRVATGFLCIRRDVIEAMVAVMPKMRVDAGPELPQLFKTYVDEERQFVGEDFAWCIEYVKQFGKNIPVWPDFDFTHGNRWSGNWHAFMNEMSAQAAAEGVALDATGGKRAADFQAAKLLAKNAATAVPK